MEGSTEETTIDVEDTRRRMGTDANILDIRSEDEWQRVGNIPGAIPVREEDPGEAAKRIDEEHTVIVVCEDGDRSAEVAESLREGGRDAVSLEGGMTAWSNAGLPMQPTEDPALASDPGSVEDETSDEGDAEAAGSDEAAPGHDEDGSEREQGDSPREQGDSGPDDEPAPEGETEPSSR